MRDERIICDYCGSSFKEGDGWRLVPPIGRSVYASSSAGMKGLDACNRCMSELEAKRVRKEKGEEG